MRNKINSHCIIYFINEKPISDFQIKTNLFSNHFSSQYTPVKNASTLSNFKYKTDKKLISFDIYADDMLLITKNLNVNKSHDWDNLSVAMTKICG